MSVQGLMGSFGLRWGGVEGDESVLISDFQMLIGMQCGQDQKQNEEYTNLLWIDNWLLYVTDIRPNKKY